MANGKATDKIKINAAERRAKVIELRKAGGSYRAIAVSVGVSPEQVRRDLNASLAGLLQEEAGAMAGMRQLESERLDALTLSFWEGAVKLKDPEAAGIILKCMDRRAKLFGLDSPVKQATLMQGDITLRVDYADPEHETAESETGKERGGYSLEPANSSSNPDTIEIDLA
jgi:hypothetical protein